MPFLCDLPLSIAGVIVLITGTLRVSGSRKIHGTPARLIGFLLLIPTLLALYWTLSQSRNSPRADTTSSLYLLSLLVVPLLAAIVAVATPESSSGRKSLQLEVFTLPEAASYLKTSEQDVLQLIQNGELRARRIGNEYRIHRDRLDEIPQEWLHPDS